MPGPEPAATEENEAMWTLKAISLCVALALASTPGRADVPDPGLRYQVVDVAAGDRLNVREQPGVDSDMLGALVPGAKNLVITGSVTNVGGANWWEIVFVEGYLSRGWVNGRFLEPMDRQEPESGYPLMCSGTEPFWSLDLADGQASYSTPEEKALALSAGPWMMASGQTGRFAVKLERDGALGYAGIWRESSFCSDGMSDIRHPFGTILIRPDGEVLAGCCRRVQ